MKIEKFQKKCELCDIEIETVRHLFIECPEAQKCYKWLQRKMEFKYIALNTSNFFLMDNFENDEIEFLALYKLTLWDVRNNIQDYNKQILEIFKKCYYKNKAKSNFKWKNQTSILIH